jgi:hypothetical protein
VRRDLVAAALVLVLAGCGGKGRDGVSLDGSPRIADDEGIVTAVDLSSVTLDGARTYLVDDDLVSFSDIDLRPVPLLFTEHQYVQIGADGHTARWIAAVARPVMTDPPVVLYSGTVKTVDGSHLVFTNGTVLTVGDDVDVSRSRGKQVQVSLVPDTHSVTEVEVL